MTGEDMMVVKIGLLPMVLIGTLLMGVAGPNVMKGIVHSVHEASAANVIMTAIGAALLLTALVALAMMGGG